MPLSNKRFSIPSAEWLLAALAVFCVSAVVFWIDLTPRVESDFFFSPEDPQLQTAQEISRLFPAPELVVIRAEAPDIDSDEYEDLVGSLTAELDTVTGVSSVASMSTEDERRSPVWSRLLLTPEDLATNIIVSAYDPDPAVLIPRLEAVWEPYEAENFKLDVSGVPYV